MSELYDPAWVAAFYDKYGDKEWARWDTNAVQAVRFHVHRYHLAQAIRPGMRVLEAGAASGRFTRELAALGAQVVALDLSPGQLALHAENAQSYGFDAAVEARVLADICDLGRFGEGSFDAVVCYGGPLSYALDRRDAALRELLRVLKPGGPLLLSVMSNWGTHQEHLRDILAGGTGEQVAEVIRTGDLHPLTWPVATHRCHLFTSGELRSWLGSHGVQVESLAASNALTTAHHPGLDPLRKDASRWATLLALELEACAQPGMLDMGTHLIAVAKKPGSPAPV